VARRQRREAADDLRKFREELRRATEAAGALNRANRSQARVGVSAAGGAAAGGAVGGAIGGAVPQIKAAVEAGRLFTVAMQAAASELTGFSEQLAKGLGDVAASVRTTLDSLQVGLSASARTTGELRPFAEAGVEVPQEVINRVAARNLAREQRAAELENRVQGATAAAVLTGGAHDRARQLYGPGR